MASSIKSKEKKTIHQSDQHSEISEIIAHKLKTNSSTEGL